MAVAVCTIPACIRPVSYTHLEVYKRQAVFLIDDNVYFEQGLFVIGFRIDKSDIILWKSIGRNLEIGVFSILMNF